MKDRLIALSETIKKKFMIDNDLKKNLDETRLKMKQDATNAILSETPKQKLLIKKNKNHFYLKKKKKFISNCTKNINCQKNSTKNYQIKNVNRF